MQKWILALGLMTWLQTGSLLAGSVTATIDKTAGTVDDDFEYTLTITGRANSTPSFPNVSGVTVTGTGQSSRTSMTFGSVTHETEFTYRLRIDAPGRYVIPPIQVEIDGKVEQSAAITLNISDAQASPSPGQHQAFMVERIFSTTSPYVGQTVAVTTSVFSESPPVELNGGLEDIAGFAKLSGTAKQQQVYKKDINGKAYYGVDLHEVLIADGAGKFQIPSSRFLIRARGKQVSRRRGFPDIDELFSFSMGSGVIEKRLSSKSDELVVKPLPAVPQGKNFSGLVGEFTFAASLAPGSVEVGDTLTLAAKIEGEGYIADDFDKLSFNFPPTLKNYPDRGVAKSEVIPEVGMHSSKEFKVALVPLQPGALTLEALSLLVFSPEQSKYVELTATLPEVQITGEARAVVTEESRDHENLALPSENQPHVAQVQKTLVTKLRSRGGWSARHGDNFAFVLFLISLFILVAALILRLRSQLLGWWTKQSVYAKKLKQLRAQVKADIEGLNARDRLRLLRDLISAHLRQDLAAKTAAEITALLQGASLSEEDTQLVIAQLVQLERDVYTENLAAHRGAFGEAITKVDNVLTRGLGAQKHE